MQSAKLTLYRNPNGQQNVVESQLSNFEVMAVLFRGIILYRNPNGELSLNKDTTAAHQMMNCRLLFRG
ncbi:hypothetical protein [Paenibacillus sinopodophylli]|uniref:hypothetical protein n=1 Tax=Paenibacillus sinopodophylli TaxID=1837342 RepID=UPI00110CC5FF|nr:hypothetical protein [Paenibacillus sinopodophylli]